MNLTRNHPLPSWPYFITLSSGKFSLMSNLNYISHNRSCFPLSLSPGGHGGRFITVLLTINFNILRDLYRGSSLDSAVPRLNKQLFQHFPLGCSFYASDISSVSPSWTISSFSMFFLQCSAQNWTLYSSGGPTRAKWSRIIISYVLGCSHTSCSACS